VQNPSLAGALELAVGHWGAIMISIGVLVSVLGAYLAWSLICAEVLFAAAKSNDMPKLFGAQNANKVPANALWLTNIVVSLFVISTYWSQDAFNFMLDMTSVTALLPYLLVAGYGVLLARSGVGYEATPNERGRDQVIAWIAVIYTLVMFVAAGLKYVLLLAVLLVPGTILYVWARRELNARLFTPVELIVFGVTVVAGAIGAWGLVTGTITP
jgi:arginine:ornithine antiporter/lysine permease